MHTLGEAVRCLSQSTGGGDGTLLVDQPPSSMTVQRVGADLDDA